MHDLREVPGGAAKVKFEIRFHLIEKFTPGTGVKRGTLRQSRLNRLDQEMALEYPYMLDPRAMLGDDRIIFIPALESVIAELNKFQFKESEVFAAQGTELSLKVGMPGFDR